MRQLYLFREFFLNHIMLPLYKLRKNEVDNTCAGIVFSKDRPLQLEALLNSYEQYVEGKALLYVLYNTSNSDFENAYDEIRKANTNIVFIKEVDFRRDLIALLKDINARKLFFLVDDILFIRKFDLNQLTNMDTDKYIPSLRMGKNITYSFMKQKEISQPDIIEYNENIICWKWNFNNSYWSYPISVDGHIFNKSEIEFAIKKVRFSAPNSLEWKLQIFEKYFRRKLGCSFENSVIVNFPWNKVQTENHNKAGEISVDELQTLWKQGKRIDIREYLNKTFNSAHAIAEMTTMNK